MAFKNNTPPRGRATLFIALILVALTLFLSSAGCQKAPRQETKIILQLNWQPEPEFGGFYAARETGAFKKQGLDVNIIAGVGGTPTVQMIGSGSVDFGILSADELVVARSKGNPVVAIFAVYQTCPQGIMTHASRKFEVIDDLFAHKGTLAIESGLPYSDFLKSRFGFDKLDIVPSPGGDVTVFLKDPNFSQQCFVTSEPLMARKNGGDPKTFLIADSGYNPYTTVVATSDKYLQSHLQTVKAIAAACREGWTSYLADPTATNAVMHGLNPGMDDATFKQAADAQKPLIQFTDRTIGSMTADRWKTLIDQLVQLKAIDKPIEAGQCFVNPAAPDPR